MALSLKICPRSAVFVFGLNQHRTSMWKSASSHPTIVSSVDMWGSVTQLNGKENICAQAALNVVTVYTFNQSRARVRSVCLWCDVRRAHINIKDRRVIALAQHLRRNMTQLSPIIFCHLAWKLNMFPTQCHISHRLCKASPSNIVCLFTAETDTAKFTAKTLLRALSWPEKTKKKKKSASHHKTNTFLLFFTILLRTKPKKKKPCRNYICSALCFARGTLTSTEAKLKRVYLFWPSSLFNTRRNWYGVRLIKIMSLVVKSVCHGVCDLPVEAYLSYTACE